MSDDESSDRFKALYGPISTEALSYVALTITTVAGEVAIVVAAISSSKLLSIPWPLLVLVVVTAVLSYIFAMAAMARMELSARLAFRIGVYGLPSEFIKESRAEGGGAPIAARFMRGWFKREEDFFGYGDSQKSEDRRFFRKLSSVRVVGALAALTFFQSVVLYVLWPHVAWCLQGVCL